MWIWDFQLRQLGFRQKNDLYWRCERGFGLSEGDHLSVFLWTQEDHQEVAGSKRAFELTEFHVTFLIDRDHIHFYYHEIQDNRWKPGGHTSSIQLKGMGLDPQSLIQEADTVAQELVQMLKGRWMSRDVSSDDIEHSE
jgi:hypothetical protein